MNRNVMKKLGRRKAGTWGRTHGPKGTNYSQKRTANKGARRTVEKEDLE